MDEISQILYVLAQHLLLPPGLFFLLMTLLLIPRVRQAKKFIVFVLFSYYLLSIPLVGHHLLLSLESYPALTLEYIKKSKAQAILVLSAGRRNQAIEYAQQDMPNGLYVDRLNYAAWLHRKTKLPLFIAGGLGKNKESLSKIGRDYLQNTWHMPVQDIEEKSKTTWQNALLSEKMLKQHKIETVLVVTHAWHLSRAMQAFNQTDLKVIPAGTVYLESYTFEWNDLLPTMSAFHQSFYALHEWLGHGWYWLKKITQTPETKHIASNET